MEDLNDGELVVRVGYSNLNYKDALAATVPARSRGGCPSSAAQTSPAL